MSVIWNLITIGVIIIQVFRNKVEQGHILPQGFRFSLLSHLCPATGTFFPHFKCAPVPSSAKPVCDLPEPLNQTKPAGPLTISVTDSVPTVCEETVFDIHHSAFDLDLVVSNTIGAVHMEDQFAVPSLGSFRAPTAAKSFPLHPLFQ